MQILDPGDVIASMMLQIWIIFFFASVMLARKKNTAVGEKPKVPLWNFEDSSSLSSADSGFWFCFMFISTLMCYF
jgi:hypothetical protein